MAIHHSQANFFFSRRRLIDNLCMLQDEVLKLLSIFFKLGVDELLKGTLLPMNMKFVLYMNRIDLDVTKLHKTLLMVRNLSQHQV